MDEIHEHRIAMTEGSRMLADVIFEARKGWPARPGMDRLIWNAGRQGIVGNPKSATTVRQGVSVARLAEEDGRVDGLRVSRDPCARCGARGDLRCGCIPKSA